VNAPLGGNLIRYILALVGAAALVVYVRRRHAEAGSTGPTADPTDSVPGNRDWLAIGQDVAVALFFLGGATVVVALVIQVGMMAKAGMLAIIGAGGLWGMCEAMKGFR
jgi:hypothetical protein